ncbi:cupin domain-containing protein [Bacillus sp. BGMRC 2118]|nr:cupin domain-containing protein [Bacillus sp. BGMRC 2118]
MILSKKLTKHYKWGADCEGWIFASNDTQTMILERMPPHTREQRHYHKYAKQLFFIIQGTAVIEIDGEAFILHEQEAIEIEKGLPHQIVNNSGEDIVFFVISQPPTVNDRYLV